VLNIHPRLCVRDVGAENSAEFGIDKQPTDEERPTFSRTNLDSHYAAIGDRWDGDGGWDGQGLGDDSVETQGASLLSPNRCRRPESIATYGPEHCSWILDMKLQAASTPRLLLI